MEEMWYRKSKGNVGWKGVQFQLDLITVCLLNALRSHKNWKISSENPKAGKYDDIVVELDLEAAVLIQAKHKENKKITRDQLLSDNSKNSDFSLAKYFLSYEEIKKKFQSRTVIICTNTAINMKGLDGILTLEQAKPDSVLYHKNGCSFYSFNENILPNLKNSAEAYLRNNSRDKGVDNTTITEENLKDFLENLQIFACYPCEHDLLQIIEKVLPISYFANLRRNVSGQAILRKVEDWFQQPKGEYLTEARAKAMLCEIRGDKYCESLKDFNVSFENNNLDIAASKRIIHVNTTGGHLLQMLKIYCALQEDKSRKLYVNPDDPVTVQKHAVEAFSLPRYTFLIMVWDVIQDESAKREIIADVKRTLDRDKYKRVILVADSKAKLAQQFELEHIYQIDGSLTLQHLSEESQERLLKTHSVVFQGDNVSVGELLSTQAAEEFSKSEVDAVMLEKIITGKDIKVGVRPPILDKNTARYYVDRRFKPKVNDETVGTIGNLITEESLYDVEEKIIVISDSAGMGKSTVLTKMAVNIKKTNPSLWVIKINLNDYTRVLRDFVTTKDKEINAAELLNSKEVTKMTNEFEKLVFSMSKKVVLMLDGADEISPDYTHLLLSLLMNCQKAANFAKIFVTTRPHVDLRLKIRLFVMLPFSRQEQIDFLTNYWMHNLYLNHYSKHKCTHYAEMLLDRISSGTVLSRYRQNPFTDIPLQVRMMAEIFQENLNGQESEWEGCKEYLKRNGTELKLPQKFNIVELYDTFIEKKRDIFVDKGRPSGSAVAAPALLNQFESCLAYHRSLAVSTLLPKDQQLFKTNIPENKDTEEYILKIGIVQRFYGRLDFIHRTFTEYFLANAIVQELKLRQTNVEFQRLLIDTILRTKKFENVRAFLNIRLKIVPLTANIFRKYRLLNREECDSNLIFELARDGHVEILKFVLKSIHLKVIKGRSISITHWRLKIPFRKRNTLNDLQVLARKAGVNIKREDGETPLHWAAKGGHFEMVDFLVKHGANVDEKNNMGFTALHHVAKLDTLNWDIVKYLVENGADADIRLGWETPLLHVAILHGSSDIVTWLVKHGADINIKDSKNNSALHIAIHNENWNIAKYLVEHGAEVNVGDEGGCTALHVAAAKNSRTDIVECLLEYGADINLKNNKKFTPLHIATFQKDWDMFEYLVEHDADVNIGDDNGTAVLHFVAFCNEIDVVKYLLEHGADINLRNRRNHTALLAATYGENWNMVKYLVQRDADVNIGSEKGFTALHFAVLFQEIDIIKYLLEHGAATDLGNNRNITALHMAIYGENWNVVEILLEHGAGDADAGNDTGLAALHMAVKYNIKAVKRLVNGGVDANVENSSRNTALHIATANGDCNHSGTKATKRLGCLSIR